MMAVLGKAYWTRTVYATVLESRPIPMEQHTLVYGSMVLDTVAVSKPMLMVHRSK